MIRSFLYFVTLVLKNLCIWWLSPT